MERHTRQNQHAYSGRRRSQWAMRSRSSAGAVRRTWLPGGIPAALTSIGRWARLQSAKGTGRYAGAAVFLLALTGSCLCLAGAGRIRGRARPTPRPPGAENKQSVVRQSAP